MSTNERSCLVKKLKDLGFEDNYISRAFRVYEKNYGLTYDMNVLTEIIVRLQNKDNEKNDDEPKLPKAGAHAMVPVPSATTAASIKAEANNLFVAKKYEQALKLYSKGIAHKDFRSNKKNLLSPEVILLKQSFYLMRARAYGNLRKFMQAKEDCKACIAILEHSKYAHKARLVRASLEIKSLEHLNFAKSDLEYILNLPKKFVEAETRRKAGFRLNIVNRRLIALRAQHLSAKHVDATSPPAQNAHKSHYKHNIHKSHHKAYHKLQKAQRSRHQMPPQALNASHAPHASHASHASHEQALLQARRRMIQKKKRAEFKFEKNEPKLEPLAQMKAQDGIEVLDEMEAFLKIRQEKFLKQANEIINNKYSVGDWLQVLDVKRNEWMIATIVDKENNWIVVHFDGLSSKFDEQIHVHMQQTRLRALGEGLEEQPQQEARAQADDTDEKQKDALVCVEDVVRPEATEMKRDTNASEAKGSGANGMQKNDTEKKKDGKGKLQEGECCVCLGDVANVVAIPCGHVSMCTKCSDEYDKTNGCPICRKQIANLYPIFMSGA